MTSGSPAFIGDFIALHSLIVVAILGTTWPLYEPSCRHPQYRGLAYYVLSLLSLFLIVTHWLGIADGFDRLSILLYRCLPDEFPDPRFRKGFTISTMACLGTALLARLTYGLAMLLTRICIRCLMSRHRHQHSEKADDLRPFCRLSSPLPARIQFLWRGLIIMPGSWVYLTIALYLIVKLRADFAAIMNDIEVQKWTFGQIPSLITWFPTVIDFIAVWSGLSSRIISTLWLRILV